MPYTTYPTIGYASHSETSYAGAQHVLDFGIAKSQEREYVTLLQQRKGCTDHEAARAMSIPASTVSARRGGLNKRWGQPVIVRGGKREGPHGLMNTIWIWVGEA